MKKFSIALILTLGIILSLFNAVSADSSKYFDSDGTAYEWGFNESTGELTIKKVYPDNYTSNDYSSVASKVKSITITGIHKGSGTPKYKFTNLSNGLTNVTSIKVSNTCNKLGSLKNCPSLKTIAFDNNSATYTTLDFTGWTSSSFPTISYNNKSSSYTYYLDYSNSKVSSVTVPVSYGSDSHITYSFNNSSVNSVSFLSGTKTIPKDAFYNCKSLRSVTIPSGVTTIGYSAFMQCEILDKITIPASVTEISYNAFHNSGVKEVTYAGTIDQWYKIIKTYDENGKLTSGNVLYLDNATIQCSDGKLFVSKNPSTGRYEYKQFIIGWYKVSGTYYYYDDKGQKVTNTTKCIDGEYYHFDSNGAMTTGWYKENGKWYFFNKSGKMQRACWFQDNGNWYYTDSEGVMVTGRKTISGIRYYFASSGAMATGWTKIGNYWYYFESSGAMCIGWKKIDGNWYFLCEQGYAQSSDNIGCMAVGRMKIDGKVYYFASTGVMQTGWVHIGDEWYYFDSKGAMQSGGWLQVGNDWYYLNDDGTVYYGWLNYNNRWYYLQHSGVMATKQITIEGRGYIFRSDGVCINPY